MRYTRLLLLFAGRRLPRFAGERGSSRDCLHTCATGGTFFGSGSTRLLSPSAQYYDARNPARRLPAYGFSAAPTPHTTPRTRLRHRRGFAASGLLLVRPPHCCRLPHSVGQPFRLNWRYGVTFATAVRSLPATRRHRVRAGRTGGAEGHAPSAYTWDAAV